MFSAGDILSLNASPFCRWLYKLLKQERQYFCQLESPLSLCLEIQSVAQKLKPAEQKLFKIIRFLDHLYH